MKIPPLKKYTPYHMAVFISSISMMFGILREFLIIGLLGFSHQNDLLQVYLSIFYTIGLMIDAMRLSCLNLYMQLTLAQMIFSASIISLPLILFFTLIMTYATVGIDFSIVIITIIGSYLNLMAALLITYKQRSNHFLSAQIINVLPNFILIPGVLLCYWLHTSHIIFTLVTLTSAIPIVQCFILLMLPTNGAVYRKINTLSFIKSLITFIRHFSAVIGEQLFQTIARAAFFNYGTGYLSLFAIIIRLYSAFRFILIDSYIGAKLFHWKIERQDGTHQTTQSIVINTILIIGTLIISIHTSSEFIYSFIQMIMIFLVGFYFSTLMRILYFKINRQQTQPLLIWHYAGYELMFAGLAFLLTKQFNHSILALLWIGYIAKPFLQWILIRKKFHKLNLAKHFA